MFVNLVLAVIKLIAGIVGHAYALVADAVESTADIFSSLVVYGGLRIAAQPADEDHPYGHGRAEALAGALTTAGTVSPRPAPERQGVFMIAVLFFMILSATRPSPLRWWLRPVSRQARVGEHNAVVWKLLSRTPPAASVSKASCSDK